MKPVQRCWILMLLALPFLLERGAAQTTSTVTTLPQILTTRSLIDLPVEFRELQDNVESQFSDGSVGLNIATLHTRFSELRDSLTSIIDRITIEADANGSAIVVSFSGPVSTRRSIPIVGIPKSYLELFGETLRNAVKSEFSVALARIRTDEWLLLNALMKAVHEERVVLGNNAFSINSDDPDPTASSIITQLVDGWIATMVQDLIAALPDSDQTKWGPLNARTNGGIDTGTTVPAKWLASYLNSQLAVARQALSRLLDKAEYVIEGVISGASKILVDASIGVNYNPGGNGSAATLGISWKPARSFMLGIALSGLVGSSALDSAHSLAAIQGRYVIPGTSIEVAGIYSTFLGSGTSEIGAGLSLKSPGPWRLGDLGYTLGVYRMRNNSPTPPDSDSLHIIGNSLTLSLSLRLLGVSSTAITLGYSINNLRIESEEKNRRFFVQTSLPINSSF